VELIRSRVLVSRHGFPTREGGVSQGPFASLNAAVSVGDERALVDENLRRLARAAEVAPGLLLTVSQVHSDVVVEAKGGGGDAITPPLAEADALWTDRVGVAVGVRTADCLPVLLEDRAGGRVAAVHAGWRGVYSRIAKGAVEAMVAHGSRVEDLYAAVGPCIQRCCFEVDGDLPERFAERFGPEVVVSVEGKARRHLDLPRAVRGSLLELGLPADHVDVLPHCTHCDLRFFSHRRSSGLTGRHLSFIACGRATDM
jgi:YfiH family protein